MPHQTVMGTMPMTVCTGWIYFMPRLTISVTAKEATSSAVLTGTEAGIIAQLLSQLVGDTRTTAADDKLVTQALGLQKLNEVG